MTEEVIDAEKSVVAMIGKSFSGAAAAADLVPAAPTASEETIEHFDFDAEFQTKVAAFAVRDDQFMRRCASLLRPEFFENVGEAILVEIALHHVQKYHSVPDSPTLNLEITDRMKSKRIRHDDAREVVIAKRALLTTSLSNREFVEERVARFAKHQAMGNAILKSVALREIGDFDKIEKMIKEAVSIGLNDHGDAYNYYERINARTEERLEMVSGKRAPQGITTGIPKMDDLLYHKGWGRKELATIMGGAKAGKSTALINFAKSASIAGKNVLYVTLEMSASIVSDRLDACISETLMKELTVHIHSVDHKIKAVAARAIGHLVIHEFPSGTLTSSQLRKLIERYKSPGRNPDGTIREPIKFDLIVVDYADIMAPEYRTDNAIENSKSVYIDLRAIATEENVAMLTATQTNREGYKAAVAKAEHVAEDFNKVRTVDLMISINKTEEEAKRGEARLYFAASRNQESGFTITIKQNLAMMVFVESVLSVE